MSEQEIPAGMKAWHGADAVPDDWDGGLVFRRAFGLVEQLETEDPGFEWMHHPHGRLHDLDIIAYTPTPATPARNTSQIGEG